MITQSDFGIRSNTSADTSGAAAGKSLAKTPDSGEVAAGHMRQLPQALHPVSPELGQLGQLANFAEPGGGLPSLLAIGMAVQKIAEHLQELYLKLAETQVKITPPQAEKLCADAQQRKAEVQQTEKEPAAPCHISQPTALQASDQAKFNAQKNRPDEMRASSADARTLARIDPTGEYACIGRQRQDGAPAPSEPALGTPANPGETQTRITRATQTLSTLGQDNRVRPAITPEQTAQIMDLLDALAGLALHPSESAATQRRLDDLTAQIKQAKDQADQLRWAAH